MPTTIDSNANLGLRQVFALWWPLAGSWLLMAAELPLLSIALLRLPDGENHLAAFGGLVYPLSMVIEGPIIMLLAAATRLSRDRTSHAWLLSVTHLMSAALTILHALVAFSPLFDWIALELIEAPPELLEPGRIGLQIMTVWTWPIAYRRVQQGSLIRVGRSDAIVVGTIVRLLTNAAVLAAGVAISDIPPVIVGSAAIAIAVISEALWAGYSQRRLARPQLPETPQGPPLEWRGFVHFYLPLALTPLLSIAIQPVGSWAMSNLDDPVASLAAWPAVHGLVFMTRSLGFAYNEVVVSLAERKGAEHALRRFGMLLALSSTSILLLLWSTPLGGLWFGAVTGMSKELTALASTALGCALLMPGISVAQNYHQGLLVHGHRTRPVKVASILYMAVSCAGLAAAVAIVTDIPGIHVTLGALTVAGIAQAWFLGRHSLLMRREMRPA